MFLYTLMLKKRVGAFYTVLHFFQNGLQSPSSSSIASTSSSISSPAFDHESLFRDVDDEIERDYETLERKRDGKKKRPITPTYRAQMEIIQLKVRVTCSFLYIWK